jgi:hypothetical protein
MLGGLPVSATAQAVCGLRGSDYANFAALGIPAEIVDAAGIVRVTDTGAREEFGIRHSGNLDGLIFPYVSPITGKRRTARLRRDFPGMKDGKPHDKYLTPYGDRRCLFFTPGCAPVLPDTAIPVIISEAEKSALAFMAHAQRTKRPCLAIATGGCWSFRGRIGITEDAKGQRVEEKGILPDFALIKWQDRKVIIAYDSDTATNPKVRAARWALALELTARGAVVHFAQLPQVKNCSGPDDVAGACGDAVLTAILDNAALFPDAARAEATAALDSIETAFPAAAISPEEIKALYAALALIDDNDTRGLLVSRAAKLLRGTVAKADLIAAVKRQQGMLAKDRAAIQEQARIAAAVNTAVDPSTLIRSLEKFFAERVFLPAGAPLLLAFFVLLTWTFELFDSCPYLLFESATVECGKTTILSLLEKVCARAQRGTALTEATLFRIVADSNPTLLIDEAESLEGSSERANALKVVAHEGYKKGAQVPRCLAETGQIQWFPVYCPKVLAAIGGLSGPLLSRSIVVHMVRAPKTFIRKSTREKAIRRDSGPLREMLESYSLQNRAQLSQLYEDEPDAGFWPSITNREAELWGGMLIHARIAGPIIESELLQVFETFTRGKRAIQAEDWQIGRTIALCEAIRQTVTQRFIPGTLLEQLEDSEAWVSTFAKTKDDKAKAAKIGRFLQSFRLKRIRERQGSSYSREEALAALTAHIPDGSTEPAFLYKLRTPAQWDCRMEQEEELRA